MFRNVISMQAVTLALGFVYARLLLAVCRRLGRGEATLAWLHIPFGLIAVGSAFVLFHVATSALALFFLTAGVVFWSGAVWVPLFSLRALRHATPWKQLWLGVVALAGLGIGTHAVLIEPFEVEAERVTISAPRLSRPLRVLHLSDLQTSGFGAREERVIALVSQMNPDVAVFTGDFVSGGNDVDATVDSARRVVGALHAPLGIFAVSGDHDGDSELERVFAGLPVTWLRNESRLLDLGGSEVWVVGLENGRPAAARAFEHVPAGAFTILLHHNPDIVFDLQGTRPDVILVGHTHGGQVVLPFLGAPVTLDRLGSRYASGLFDWDGMPLYVNRGIGLEAGFAPPVRFGCPPIVALLDLVPRATRVPAASH